MPRKKPEEDLLHRIQQADEDREMVIPSYFQLIEDFVFISVSFLLLKK